METILEVKNLVKFNNNNKILKNINLTVGQGDLVSIIGRSGCGKTTLLRCINCLEIPDYGYIRVDGIEIDFAQNQDEETLYKKNKKRRNIPENFYAKAHQIRLRVGLLFQNLNLFPHLTVLENITIAPIIVRNEDKEVAIKKAKELLAKVGLEGLENRYPHQLSGGQSQRVAIARALSMNPKIILYDEPTSALDPELVVEVLNVMKDLHRDGITQIIVTHAMNFARTASDYVIHIENGEIIEVAPPEKIFANPSDPRTEAYVRLFKEGGY